MKEIRKWSVIESSAEISSAIEGGETRAATEIEGVSFFMSGKVEVLVAKNS